MARRRARWKQHQGQLDPTRLVFIDETWAKTNMTRRHGRCRRGERLAAKVPHGRWRTLTGLSGILCARQVSSLADEPFAEDDGELHLSFEPLARRSFPFLGRVVQDQI